MFVYVLDILLVLVQTIEIQASGQYFKSDKEITWHDARKECDIAVPKVNINSDEFVMDVQEHIDSGLWVGYFTMKTAFEYIGCSKKPLTSANMRSVHNAPGLCLTACNGADFIGISGNECFCLTGKAFGSTMLTGCNTSCRSNDYIICGGYNLQSIYRLNKEVSGKEEGGDCLSFEYTDDVHKIFTWKPCSEYHPPLCTNRSVSGRNDPWSASIQQCFSLKSRPSTYKDLQNTTHTVYPSWSGIIRSEVMYMAEDFEDTYVNVRYGYLTTDRNKSNLILKFTKDGKGKKFALYQNQWFSVHTTDDYSSKSTGVSERFSEQTTDDHSSKSTGFDVGPVIGASVAAVLVVIAVVVVLVVLKRRQKNRGEHQSKADYKSEQTNYITPIPTGVDNDGYEIPNPQRNVYESLHDRGNEEHCYETTMTNSDGL